MTCRGAPVSFSYPHPSSFVVVIVVVVVWSRPANTYASIIYLCLSVGRLLSPPCSTLALLHFTDESSTAPVQQKFSTSRLPRIPKCAHSYTHTRTHRQPNKKICARARKTARLVFNESYIVTIYRILYDIYLNIIFYYFDTQLNPKKCSVCVCVCVYISNSRMQK